MPTARLPRPLCRSLYVGVIGLVAACMPFFRCGRQWLGEWPASALHQPQWRPWSLRVLDWLGALAVLPAACWGALESWQLLVWPHLARQNPFPLRCRSDMVGLIGALGFW